MSRRPRSVPVAALLAAAALGVPAPAATAPRGCDAQAGKVSDRARSMLRHYSGMVYPADVEYLLLRNSFRRFEQRRCPPAALGRALRRDLTRARRAQLLALLPADLDRAFRRALRA